MAIQFRLPEDVRAELGLDEWVTYDPDVVMLDEAIALEDALGWTPVELLANQRTPRIDPATGEQAVDAEGNKLWRRNMRAWKFMIWAAARRSGMTVPFAEFNINIMDLYTRAVEDEQVEADSGDPKEDPTDAPSTPESLPDESSGDSAT